ncbi:MAG: Do family serine endopeptidase [Thermoguttaceae bacterium]
METKLPKIRGRVWLGARLVLVALGTLAAAGAGVYGVTGNHNATQVQLTAWYSEGASAAANATASGRPGSGQISQHAVNYAHEMSTAFHNAAESALPSVVMVLNMPAEAKATVERKRTPNDNSEETPFGFQGTPFGDLFKNNPDLRRFFGESPHGSSPETPGHGTVGAGSGVIVDPSGVILTNNHVVSGGGQILVRLADGREFKAFDIKTDPTSDLALIHIKSKEPLPVAKLGNSSAMEVGDWVLALGEPFGLQGTVTAGIVSAKGRGIGINEREDYIQTDAAINPGNSGGPLVNLDGEVIGINTAISSSSGGYQGVGFAIPINLAKWVGEELVKYGTVHRAYLGVMIQPVSPSLAEQFNVKVNQGVVVTQVQAQSPAAKAGVKVGDVILDFAGQAVTSPSQLQSMVEMCKVDSAEKLTILRNGKHLAFDVVCTERPTNFSIARASHRGSGNAESSRFQKLGIQIEDLTPQVAEQLGISAEQGVVITNVRSGSPADLAGLTTGMVISDVDRQPVKTVEDFRRMLGSRPLNKGVLLLVRTDEGSRFVVIQVQSE